MNEGDPINRFEAFFRACGRVIDGPTTWFREKIVKPNQTDYPWYHQKFRRVPTIDECYTDDVVCIFEADEQYKRDRQVDTEIMAILRMRLEDCCIYEKPDHLRKCQEPYEAYKEATGNWFTKYGDLGSIHNTKTAFMKQKHRMIWERRHGPVGSGMKEQIPVE